MGDARCFATAAGQLDGRQSSGRSATGSLSRGYKYNVDTQARQLAVADGLIGVPIQVWSTMTFDMAWTGTLSKEKLPVTDIDLFHPPGSKGSVAGSFRLNLPIGATKKPLLIYAGEVYELPSVMPGQRIEIPGIGAGKEDGLPRQSDWFSRLNVPNESNNSYDNTNGGAVSKTPLWSTLFHDKVSSGSIDDIHNASLRLLDESWRISSDNRDEAILLIAVPAQSAPAEELMTRPDGPSPSLVWLRGLPSEGITRQPMPGTLKQETYIRIYIPIGK